MSLSGKMEANVEIKTPASMIHELFSSKASHLADMSPGIIQSVDLLEGEWGKSGSICNWKYVYEGKPVGVKVRTMIDEEKMAISFEAMEGDLMKLYRNFKSGLQITPKGDGSVVQWIIEYEKMNKEVPNPDGLLNMVFAITKDIDTHLSAAYN